MISMVNREMSMVLEESAIWLGCTIVVMEGCRVGGVVWVEVRSPINIKQNVEWQRIINSKQIGKSIKLLCHMHNGKNKIGEKYTGYVDCGL